MTAPVRVAVSVRPHRSRDDATLAMPVEGPLVDRYGLSAAAAFAAIVFGAGVVFAMLDARFAQRSAA